MSQGLPQFDPSFYTGEIFWLFLSFGALWVSLHYWIMPHFYHVEKKRKSSLDYIVKETLLLEEKNTHLRELYGKKIKDMEKNIGHERQCLLEKYAEEKQTENTKIREDYEHFLKDNEQRYQKIFQEEKASLNQKKIKDLLDDFIQKMKSS